MIGYRNHEHPEETDEFLPEELKVKSEVEAALKKVHDARNALHTLELRKSVLQLRCPHTVFTDKYNDPHDHRICLICGKSLGVI